jgi:hypothetical protein
MKLLTAFLAAGFVFLGMGGSTEAAPSGFKFKRVEPEEKGVQSAALLKWVEALDSKVEGMHSLMLVVQGDVIAEGWWTPYEPEYRHTMYSLSKSFTSTAVGLAQAEGKLSIDDTVLSFFPNLAPTNASANLKAMRVRDLLAMSSGHHNEDIAKFDYQSEDAIKQFLALPVAHKPGTHFVYNTPGSFMLSAIVQKATSQSVLEYLKPRLFDPLGIENPVWDAGKSGINLGGFGLHLRTEDIARFGWLYWTEGNWGGKQILPKEWVKAATSRQTSNGSNPKSDWDQGYGYQFWRCRNGSFRGDGAFGQYCIVMPNEGAVLAITSGVRDMQQVLDITWDTLLPALRVSGLPTIPANQRALHQKLDSLSMKPVNGAGSSEVSPQITGKKFIFDKNADQLEAVSLEAKPTGGYILMAKLNGKERRVPVAPGKWQNGTFAFNDISPLEANRDEPAAGAGAWDGNTFVAKIAFVETPYHLTLRMHFTKDQVAIDPELNVSFSGPKRPQLLGRLE